MVGCGVRQRQGKDSIVEILGWMEESWTRVEDLEGEYAGRIER